MKLLLVCLSLFGATWGYEYSNTTCACGWRNSGRIIGGKETKKNEYPWMAYLGTCGGTILTRWHVLTAAHCTIRRGPKDLKVSVGRYRTNVGQEEYSQHLTVEAIIQHKLYHPVHVYNDISVLFLSQPIRFSQNVGPVCMPNRQVDFVGQYLKALGWGDTQGTGDRTFLREADLKVIPLDKCSESWPKIQYPPTQICTLDSERKKNVCGGDSGGPLVYLDPDTNRYTQAALVSYGVEKCRGTTYPAVNTDVAAFIDWINDAISSTKPDEHVCTKY